MLPTYTSLKISVFNQKRTICRMCWNVYKYVLKNNKRVKVNFKIWKCLKTTYYATDIKKSPSVLERLRWKYLFHPISSLLTSLLWLLVCISRCRRRLTYVYSGFQGRIYLSFGLPFCYTSSRIKYKENEKRRAWTCPRCGGTAMPVHVIVHKTLFSAHLQLDWSSVQIQFCQLLHYPILGNHSTTPFNLPSRWRSSWASGSSVHCVGSCC